MLDSRLDRADRRLAEQVVVVTGGGQGPDGPIGVGAAIAIVLALHGASVVVADQDADSGERTVEHIRSLGASAVFAPGDVSSMDDCTEIAASVVDRFGRIDGLVNNAASSRHAGILEATSDDFLETYRINTIGPLQMSQACVPYLGLQGGSIVNIGSIAGVRPIGPSAYAESKAALVALTQQSAITLGRRGIRVNCLHPGHLYAPMTAGADEETRRRRATQNMLGIEGTGWDVAFAVLFLCSDDSRWITGVAMCVDAGATLLTPASFEQLVASQ